MIPLTDPLKNIIRSKQAALDKSPKGNLRISGTPEKPMYYYRSDACSFGGKYLNKDHLETARQLAQRDYDRRILKSAEAELEHLNRSLNLLANKIPVELVYERLRPQRQSLVDPIHLPDEEYLKL
jgi:transposase-like protein